MKRLFKKKSEKLTKGTSTAALLSIGIHLLLFLLAGVLVVFTVVRKDELEFEPPQAVERPKMKLKKPKVKVKKTSKPKTSRIVSKSTRTSMPDIELPEMGGLGDGLGEAVVGFDLMPDIGDVTLLGSAQSIGNDFEGTFYDFNRKRNGERAEIGNQQCVEVLARFVKGGWHKSKLAQYYQSPKKLYTTTFAIPPVQTGMAPAAFGEPESSSWNFGMHYEGKLVYPEDIKIRFWGHGDDIFVIRVDGEIVLNAPYPRTDGHRNDTKLVGQDWQSTSPKTRTYWLGNHLSVVGDWIELKAGEPLDMEVLIAECAGGLFQAMLIVEVEGETYERNLERGGPTLPLFKTAELSIDLYEEIANGTWVGDAQLLGGPIFCDYDTTTASEENFYPKAEVPADEEPVFTIAPETKAWTNNTGQSFVTGKYITRVSDYVLLEPKGGKQLKVPLATLAPEELKYVELMSGARFNINFSKSTDYVPPPALSPYESGQRPMQLSDFTYKTTVKQSSLQNYNQELAVEVFAIGQEVDGNNYVLLDRREARFTPSRENKESISIDNKDDPVRLEVSSYRSAAPMRGVKYEGYLVTVKDERGVIIQYDTSHDWTIDMLWKLKQLPVGKHFNKEGDRVCPPRPTPDDRYNKI